MSRAFLEDVKARLAGIEAEGLYKRERMIEGPQGGRIRVAGREMVNLCANNYLGLADHPDVVAAARVSARDLRLRHGLGALHLRRAGPAPRARARDRRASRSGRRDPVRRLFRRQRRRVRAAARRKRRYHLGRAQPRLDHRRRAALQGQTLPLRQLRHGRTGEPPERGGRRALQADRHRRRVLDGRPYRQAERNPRARRQIRCAGDERRVPRHGPSRPPGQGRAGADRRARRYRDGHFRQDARRRDGRLRRRRAADRRSVAPARAALSVLQLARAARRRRLAQGAARSPSAPTICAPG